MYRQIRISQALQIIVSLIDTKLSLPPETEISLSDLTVRKGALFDASGARVPFPEDEAYERCYVALVDPNPTARWGHHAYWVFVPACRESVAQFKETDMPEHMNGPVRMLPVCQKDIRLAREAVAQIKSDSFLEAFLNLRDVFFGLYEDKSPRADAVKEALEAMWFQLSDEERIIIG